LWNHNKLVFYCWLRVLCPDLSNNFVSPDQAENRLNERGHHNSAGFNKAERRSQMECSHGDCGAIATWIVREISLGGDEVREQMRQYLCTSHVTAEYGDRKGTVFVNSHGIFTGGSDGTGTIRYVSLITAPAPTTQFVSQFVADANEDV
jgi:hypothetical protein